MTPSPILRVLSTLRRQGVDFLLMGGQACILYGAAEFSRDIDVAIRVAGDNLDRLRAALAELEAEPVYVPPLSAEALEAGHACHFRCQVADARGLRLDVMGRMRGVEDWPVIWGRRERIDVPGLGTVAVLGLADLIRAKKTQRDKDWPMIRRLVEADMVRRARTATDEQVLLWLRECRTPELLVALSVAHPRLARSVARDRAAVRAAAAGRIEDLRRHLSEEEERERRSDREYWRPLREELLHLRRRRGRA